MALREDYILRFLALLRQAIAQMIKLRTAGRYTEALDTALQSQEKLFARTTAELARLSLDEMLRLLRLDEHKETADAKVLAYSSLLRETGLVYAAMDRNDSAISCFQLALHVRLTVAVGPQAVSEEMRESLRELLARIPAEELNPPVKEMLQHLVDPIPPL